MRLLAYFYFLLSLKYKEKIYLVGESWGSALGIMLLKEKPEYYAGFVGTGQMVALRNGYTNLEVPVYLFQISESHSIYSELSSFMKEMVE